MAKNYSEKDFVDFANSIGFELKKDQNGKLFYMKEDSKINFCDIGAFFKVLELQKYKNLKDFGNDALLSLGETKKPKGDITKDVLKKCLKESVERENKIKKYLKSEIVYFEENIKNINDKFKD